MTDEQNPHDHSFHLSELGEHLPDAGHVHHDPNHLTHNGVAIPDEVFRQLKMVLGESVHTMDSHELDKAARNFAANGQVIRDDDGVHLHDMMHEHWEVEHPHAGDDEHHTVYGHHPEDDDHPPIFGHEHDDEAELHADDKTPPATPQTDPLSFAQRLLNEKSGAAKTTMTP